MNMRDEAGERIGYTRADAHEHARQSAQSARADRGLTGGVATGAQPGFIDTLRGSASIDETFAKNVVRASKHSTRQFTVGASKSGFDEDDDIDVRERECTARRVAREGGAAGRSMCFLCGIRRLMCFHRLLVFRDR